MKRIYLDHNATSPVRPEVMEQIQEFLSKTLANPSSVHQSGKRIRRAIDQAREDVARLIHASPSEIIFTSGATEANHLAWKAFQRSGQRIITTKIEHPSVLGGASKAQEMGAKVVFIRASKSGTLETEEVAGAIQEGVNFASIHHANNETGIVYPIQRMAQNMRSPSFIFHTDAVQTVGRIPIDVKELNADLLTISGHKLGALAGIGALYVRRGVPFEPLWEGGPQEKGRRVGTENCLGIVSLGAACRILYQCQESEGQQIFELRNHFENELVSRISGSEITGKGQPRLPNTTHITFEDLDGESLLIAADLEEIDCSTGAACSSGSLKPSHVLLAMGFSLEQAHGSLRFSLGWNTQEKDISQALEILPKLVTQVRTSGQTNFRKIAQ